MNARPKPPEEDPLRSIDEILHDWRAITYMKAHSIGERRGITVEWQSAIKELAKLRAKAAKWDEHEAAEVYEEPNDGQTF